MQSSLAGRNVQRRLLHVYTYAGLCVSRLHNLTSVAVYNSLAGRNVQRSLLDQYTYVGVHKSLTGRNVQRRL